MFTNFAGIAQFERDLTSKRAKEGILAAKKGGGYPGRTKADEEKINYALCLINQGVITDGLCKHMLIHSHEFNYVEDKLYQQYRGLKITIETGGACS